MPTDLAANGRSFSKTLGAASTPAIRRTHRRRAPSPSYRASLVPDATHAFPRRLTDVGLYPIRPQKNTARVLRRLSQRIGNRPARWIHRPELILLDEAVAPATFGARAQSRSARRLQPNTISVTLRQPRPQRSAQNYRTVFPRHAARRKSFRGRREPKRSSDLADVRYTKALIRRAPEDSRIVGRM